MKKAFNHLVASASALLLLTACGPSGGPEAELVGVYAVKKNDFSTGTGYFLFYSQGPVEVHKL